MIRATGTVGTAHDAQRGGVMSWATPYLPKLAQGEPVTFRPRGHSMEPLISSGQEVTVEPIGDEAIQPGDVVLCHVRGQHYLHLVKAVQGERYLIGNNRGRINGWVTRRAIHGRWIRR